MKTIFHWKLSKKDKIEGMRMFYVLNSSTKSHINSKNGFNLFKLKKSVNESLNNTVSKSQKSHFFLVDRKKN